jgi:hypothetical protein
VLQDNPEETELICVVEDHWRVFSWSLSVGKRRRQGCTEEMLGYDLGKTKVFVILWVF